MNRHYLWKFTPLSLLLTSMAWTVQAQDDFRLEKLSDDISATEQNVTITGATDPTNNLRVEGSLTSDEDEIMVFPVKVHYSASHLEKASRNLVKKYRDSSDAKQREDLQSKLQEVVSQQFDLLQKERKSELTKLKQELNRLQALHDRRQDQKDRIVGDRVQSLLREADGLGWGSTRSNRRSRDRSPYGDSFPNNPGTFPSSLPVPTLVAPSAPATPVQPPQTKR